MTQFYGPYVGGEGDPIGKTYLSVAATEAGVDRPLVPGTRVRLKVRKDGTFIARAGCNHLSGVIMVIDGVLRIELAEWTLMGCGPELEAQDDWLAELLMHQPDCDVVGDTLTLTSGGTTLVLLDRRIAEPDLPLDGTIWTVESVVRGDGGPFEHYGGAGPATLILNGAQATGSTGGSPFTAAVTRDNRTLTFADVTLTPARPTGRAADLEQAVLENLRTPLNYAIESNHLELRGPTRTTGLNLTAVRPDGNPRGTW
jgi:heat shock protein HslJ